MCITAGELINDGYVKIGNFFVHKNDNISINLLSNTIRGYKPIFCIERKNNKISINDLNNLSEILIKLSD
jgi:hypothetical protein